MRRMLVMASVTVLMVGTIAAPGHAEDTGQIAVTVSFEGTPPPAKAINFGAEKQCALSHASGAPTYEDIVVNANGTLKWVLVYVKEGFSGVVTPLQEPVIVDQAGCIFKPHVTAVTIGQPVEFRNNDPVLHNVRGVSKQAQNFNVAQPTQGMKTTKTFKNPELGMQVRCDVHFWMTAYLHVLTNPFYGVTGDQGTATLQRVPPGTYTLEVWHEKFGTQTQSVTVQVGQTQQVAFVFKGA